MEEEESSLEERDCSGGVAGIEVIPLNTARQAAGGGGDGTNGIEGPLDEFVKHQMISSDSEHEEEEEDEEEDEGEPTCPSCRVVMEIAQRLNQLDVSCSSSINSSAEWAETELEPTDAHVMVEFVKGLSDSGKNRSSCNCFFNDSRLYWIFINLLVKTIEFLASEHFWKLNEVDLSEEDGLLAQQPTTSHPVESNQQVNDEFKAQLLIFCTELLSERHLIYTLADRKEILNDSLGMDCDRTCDLLDSPLRFRAFQQQPNQQWLFPLAKLLQTVLDGSFLAALHDMLELVSYHQMTNSEIYHWVNFLTTMRTVVNCTYKPQVAQHLSLFARMLRLELCARPEAMRDPFLRSAVDRLWRNACDDGCCMPDHRQALLLIVSHLNSPYMQPRITAINQISDCIRCSFDATLASVTSPGEIEPRSLSTALAEELCGVGDVDEEDGPVNVVRLLFGEHCHPETVKQSASLLEFLIRKDKFTASHLALVWNASLVKKECSKYVLEVLISVCRYFEPVHVVQLYRYLQAMPHSEHTEQSISLTFHLLNTLWRFGFLRAQYLSNTPAVTSRGTVPPGTPPNHGRAEEDAIATSTPLRIGHSKPTAVVEHEEYSTDSTEEKEDDDLVVVASTSQANIVVSDSPASSKKRSSDSSPKAQRTKRQKLVVTGYDNPVVCVEDVTPSLQSPVLSPTIAGFSPVTNLTEHERIKLASVSRMPRNFGMDEHVDEDDESDVSSDRATSASDQQMLDMDDEEEDEEEDDDDDELLDASASPNLPVAAPIAAGDSKGMSAIAVRRSVVTRRRIGVDVLARRFAPLTVPPTPRGAISRLIKPTGGHQVVVPNLHVLKFLDPNIDFPTLHPTDLTGHGRTLLWDLLMDNSLTAAGEKERCLARTLLLELIYGCQGDPFEGVIEAFVDASLSHLKENIAVDPQPLFLISKLLYSLLTEDRKQQGVDVLLPIVERFDLPRVLCENLVLFCGAVYVTDEQDSKRSQGIRCRLDFLKLVFAHFTPTTYCMSKPHFALMWKMLLPAKDDRWLLFDWLYEQLTHEATHALSSDLRRYILHNCMKCLEPESVTEIELNVVKELIRYGAHRPLDDTDDVNCLPLLWQVALRNSRTEISKSAMNFLNYVYADDGGSSASKKQCDFVDICLNNLREAVNSLTVADAETGLTRLHRALLMLKTHLDDYRRRHSYWVRSWEHEHDRLIPHGRMFTLNGGGPLDANGVFAAPYIRVGVQVSGATKLFLPVSPTMTLGEFRADIANMFRQHVIADVAEAANEPTAGTSAHGTAVGDSDIEPVCVESDVGLQHRMRFLYMGKEWNAAQSDHMTLAEIGLRDNQTVTVSFGSSVRHSAIPSAATSLLLPTTSVLPMPCLQSSPMVQLSTEENWSLLMRVIETLDSLAPQLDTDQSHRCRVFGQRAWDLVNSLPTNGRIRAQIAAIVDAERPPGTSPSAGVEQWRTHLDSSKRHLLLYSLHILTSAAFANPDRLRDSGVITVLLELLSNTIVELNTVGTTQQQFDCICLAIKSLYTLCLSSDHSKCSTRENKPNNEMNSFRIELLEGKQNDLIVRLCDFLQLLARHRYSHLSPFPIALHCHWGFRLLVATILSQPTQLMSVFLTYPDLSAWLKSLLLETTSCYVRQEASTALSQLCGVKVAPLTESGERPSTLLLTRLLSLLSDAVAIVPAAAPLCRSDDGDLDASADGLSLFSTAVGSSSSAGATDVGKKKAEDSQSANRQPCSRCYFELLHRLIDACAEEERKTVDLATVLVEIYGYLEKRPIYETDAYRSMITRDDGLIGLVILATDICRICPQLKSTEQCQKLLELCWQLLFATPTCTAKNLPKCRSDDSRVAVFDLVVEICRCSTDNYRTVHSWLLSQLANVDGECLPWDYWPREERRSAAGYVGMLNLGATCYLATAMQHLFMIPEVRAAVLNVDATTTAQHTDELEQLQKMFVFLQESKRKAFDPREFCKAYHMNAEILSTTEQKDMSEFFIDVVTKMEEMSPKLKSSMKSLFCGVLSNNVVSEDCNHVSRNTEDCYAVRCRVEGMKDLYASLDGLTAADVLDGDNMYNCGQCNKQVRAKRRTCFKQLPDILSFNTMRYSFNMVSMTKEKVNTHFSFPLRLDMRPYMEETLTPPTTDDKDDGERRTSDYYEYELIGVTVHTGTAEGGHYYSYIRDPFDSSKWLWFNDADVRIWDLSQLEIECFGGEIPRHQFEMALTPVESGGRLPMTDQPWERSNSAYMLFYQRVNYGPQRALDALTTLAPQLHLQQWIWSDNEKFTTHLMLFSHKYSHFIWQMTTEVISDLPLSDGGGKDNDMTFQAAVLCITYVMEMLIHSKEKPHMNKYTERLAKLLDGSNDACKWFLSSMSGDVVSDGTRQCRWAYDILLQCPSQQCRFIFQSLIQRVFLQLHDRCHERTLYKHHPRAMSPLPARSADATNECEEVMDFEGQETRSYIAAFLLHLMELIRKSDVEMRQLVETIALLIGFATLSGEESRRFLLDIRVISTLVQHYMTKTEEDLALYGEEENCEEALLLDYVRSALFHRPINIGPALEKMANLFIMLLDYATKQNYPMKQDCIAALVGFGKRKPVFLIQQVKDASNMATAVKLIMAVSELASSLPQQIVVTLFEEIRCTNKEQHTLPIFNALTELCVACSVYHHDSHGLQSPLPSVSSTVTSAGSSSAALVAPSNDDDPSSTALSPTTVKQHELFMRLIVLEMWRICDSRPTAILQWLERTVRTTGGATASLLGDVLLGSMDNWVERFLLQHLNAATRLAAAQLLLALVPSQCVRQHFLLLMRPAFGGGSPQPKTPSADAIPILHQILEQLLSFITSAQLTQYGTHKASSNRLVCFWHVLRTCLVSDDEKRMFAEIAGPYLWRIFDDCCGDRSKKDANKQALLSLWRCAVTSDNCQTELISAFLRTNEERVRRRADQFMLNYIVKDQSDRELILYNRQSLHNFYHLVKLFCRESPVFCRQVANHNNLLWATTTIGVGVDYPKAVEELVGILEQCCHLPDGVGRQFKREKLWPWIVTMLSESKANFNLFLRTVLRNVFCDTPEDKLYFLQNNILNFISSTFDTLCNMFYEATACNVTSDIGELLKRLYDLLCRTLQIKESKLTTTAQEILDGWGDARMMSVKLLRLLNSFVPSDVRHQAILCLKTMVTLYAEDETFITQLLNHLHDCHLKATKQNYGRIPELGPHFPKRQGSSSSEMSESKKGHLHGALDMSLNSLLLEAEKGIDSAYDRQLRDYFLPYHQFADQLIRCAVNLLGDTAVDSICRTSTTATSADASSFSPPTTVMSPPVIDAAAALSAGVASSNTIVSGQVQDSIERIATLSALLGIEGLPLHCVLFPKLCLEIADKAHKKGGIIATLLDSMTSSRQLYDYVRKALSSDQGNISSPVVFSFLKKLMPKLSKELLGDAKERLVFLSNAEVSIKEALNVLSGHDQTIRAQHLSHLLVGGLGVVELLAEYLTADELAKVHSTIQNLLDPIVDKVNMFVEEIDDEECSNCFRRIQNAIASMEQELCRFQATTDEFETSSSSVAELSATEKATDDMPTPPE